MLIKVEKPVIATTIIDKKKEDFAIISIKDAAQQLMVPVQTIEYLISNEKGGNESTLDYAYPLAHDEQNTGAKCVVQNQKWFDYLEKRKNK